MTMPSEATARPYTIPEELISDVTPEMEERLSVQVAAGDREHLEPDASDTYGLPNRPLRQNEVLLQSDNSQLRVVNLAAPPQYVRLYDADGRERLILAPLAEFFLAQTTRDGERVFFARPPVKPKPNELHCKFPGCKKMLPTKMDRDLHHRFFHESWWRSEQEEEWLKRERTQRRQADAMVAMVAQIAARQFSDEEELDDVPEEEVDGPPDPSWNRQELMTYIRKHGEWKSAYFRMTRDELFAVAMELANAEESDPDA